jgi:hypothetical protein
MDLVAVGITQIGTEIAGTIMRTRARWTLILAAILNSQAMGKLHSNCGRG